MASYLSNLRPLITLQNELFASSPFHHATLTHLHYSKAWKSLKLPIFYFYILLSSCTSTIQISFRLLSVTPLSRYPQRINIIQDHQVQLLFTQSSHKLRYFQYKILLYQIWNFLSSNDKTLKILCFNVIFCIFDFIFCVFSLFATFFLFIIKIK